MSSFDRFLADIDRMQQSEAHSRQLYSARLDYAELAVVNSSARLALKELDPSNPLFADDVHEKLLDLGNNTYRRTEDWDQVREAGRQFYRDLKYTPKVTAQVAQLQQENAALKETVEALQKRISEYDEALQSWKRGYERLEETNIWNYAEKLVYRQALETIDKNHPVLTDTPWMSGVRKMATTTYAMSEKSYDKVKSTVLTAARPPSVIPSLRSLEYYKGEREALQKRLDYLNDPAEQEKRNKMVDEVERIVRERQAAQGGQAPNGTQK